MGQLGSEILRFPRIVNHVASFGVGLTVLPDAEELVGYSSDKGRVVLDGDCSACSIGAVAVVFLFGVRAVFDMLGKGWREPISCHLVIDVVNPQVDVFVRCAGASSRCGHGQPFVLQRVQLVA